MIDNTLDQASEPSSAEENEYTYIHTKYMLYVFIYLCLVTQFQIRTIWKKNVFKISERIEPDLLAVKATWGHQLFTLKPQVCLRDQDGNSVLG